MKDNIHGFLEGEEQVNVGSNKVIPSKSED